MARPIGIYTRLAQQEGLKGKVIKQILRPAGTALAYRCMVNECKRRKGRKSRTKAF